MDVSDPSTSKPVNCDVYDAWKHYLLKNQPCSFSIQPQGWYRIDQLYHGSGGYVTVGIQRQGEQTTTAPVDFSVEQVSVPK